MRIDPLCLVRNAFGRVCVVVDAAARTRADLLLFFVFLFLVASRERKFSFGRVCSVLSVVVVLLLQCPWLTCCPKTFPLPAPIFTGRARWRQFTSTATTLVVNKLEKAAPELAEAKRERDEAKGKLDEAERELKMAKSELKKLIEKRERGELVDKDDFARADKAVDRADKAVENARADVQRAHEIYTKLLPGAIGAYSCVCNRCARSLL